MSVVMSPETETTRGRRRAVRARALLKKARAFPRSFQRDDSGVMIAYSLFFLLIMLMVGGIGVDFMHYEMKRTRLQNTLDNAVLAAADMQQPQAAADVVADYLDKAGLDAVLTGAPTVHSGLNYRDVTASASLTVPTQFIHMLGFDTLTAPASAKAEERIEGLEIALVLDVSGSMGRNNRLVNLKPAAREFIDTVIGLADAGDVSVSIVPYNTQVAAGAALLNNYNVSTEHNFSNCVNFAASDFNSPALSPAAPLERTMHFDMFTYSSGAYPAAGNVLDAPVCPTNPASEIMVMSTDDVALKAKINGLSAGGNTSIDIGMKWAAALLDPGTRPVVNQMISNGDVSPLVAGKPLNYDEPGALKVVVVMTDGQNTNQYMLPDAMRTQASNVWIEPASQRMSIYYDRSGSDDYFWKHDSSWHDRPYGVPPGVDPATVASVHNLSYAELFAMNSVATNAWYNYGPLMNSIMSNGYNTAWDTWYSNLPDRVNGTAKDARLQSICDQVKNNGVMVYAIGFEATANGNAQLQQCASTPSHFFDAQGTSITDVFQAIAVSIAQLRLTQ